MSNANVETTRNFALIGHAGDGKTSLGEAILHGARATSSLGSVDSGTSVLNHLPEEKSNGHTATITSHVFSFDWEEHSLTLVDTPGDPNFQGDGQVALQALDGGVLLVSAVDGAKFGTEKMFRAARSSGVAVVAFVNGLDRERADFGSAVESLSGLDVKPVVVSFPLGSSSDLSGVVDLMTMKLCTASRQDAIPAEAAEEAEALRLELVEAAAECDDALLEKYLEEGELSDEEVAHALAGGTHSGQILPVFAGSSTQEVGIGPLLRGLRDVLPSPAARGNWASTDPEAEGPAPDPDGTFSAVVFKTIMDRYAGTLSVFRVVSGTLQPDSSVLNASTGTKTRVGKLFVLQGEKHEDVDLAGPGAIVAVAKMKDVHTSNVLSAEKAALKLPEPVAPQGVLSYAIQAKSQGDEDKVYTALGRLVEEDPTLQLGREASTGEFLLTGMGELHIRTTVQKMRRMFEVDVELKTPKIPYRETVTRSAQHVEGKLKKQSGGKGMYGVCYLNIEPLPRGEGVEFIDKIVGGSIPRGLIPAVEKGVMEACERGPLAGYPVVDLRVTCVDGKHHSVDSNEMAFKLAGSFGFKAAVEQARPTLLEPVMNAEISCPDESVGDIMGDIASRRGRVQSSENRGTASVICALLPMSEMLEYASVLTSLTGGKGAFHMEFSHYDEVPVSHRDKITAEAKAAAEDES